MPAKVCIALSMQWCPGTKQPSIWSLAAFTMASAERRVMSPRQSATRESTGSAAPTGGSTAASTAPPRSLRRSAR